VGNKDAVLKGILWIFGHWKESGGLMTEEEEFDLEDLRYYRNPSAREKLEYLEKMNLFLLKITPEKAKQRNEKLKDEGF
jgi:hypothetical protein